MKDILVSLVIPTYNIEKLLPLTLNSVMNQTLSNFECIIVDDFSTDRTKSIAYSYAKKDKRFKVVIHRANYGASTARNTGLRFARGRYVAFLDSDDLIMPDSLELRAKTLESNLDKDVIGTYSGTFTIQMDRKTPPIGKNVELKNIDFISTNGNCPFNANQPMFKTHLFKKLGGFDQSLIKAEDYEMWMRALRYGFKIIPTNKQLVTYRQTEGSVIRDNPLLHLDTSYQHFQEYYQLLPAEKWNDKFDNILSGGLNEYFKEVNFCPRVLEFIGIGVAKGDNYDELVERLYSYLPHYFEILELNEPFLQRVNVGVNRYFKKNIDLNDPKYFELKERVDAIYNNFKNKVVENRSQKLNKISYQFTTENIVSIPMVQSSIDIIFFPHKDYHIKEISLLAPFLKDNDISFIVVDLSMHYRDEGVPKACEEYNIEKIGYSNFVLGNFKPRALITFNDWDPIVWSIIKRANECDITTIGIVEGIQDYDDADTKQDRRTYKTVKHVFVPGEHDKKYFSGSNPKVYVGGIPRIYEMYKSNKKDVLNPKKVALINSNFSYGILVEHRDSWLTSAVNACYKAGYKPIITKHPADKGTLFNDLVTSKSFYEALDDSTVLISRFASGILEAMAVKKPAIYFNPHGEKADKFQNPNGAFPIINNEIELSNELSGLEIKYSSYSKRFEAYLEKHCGIKVNPSKTIADTISKEILSKNKQVSFESFFSSLQELDHRSGSFNNIEILRKDKATEQQLISSTPKTVKMRSVPKVDKNSEVSLLLGIELIKQKKYKEAELVFSKLMAINPQKAAFKTTVNSLKMLSKSGKS